MSQLHKMKIRKYICFAGLLLFCFSFTDQRVESEENAVTMTEFDASADARKSAQEGSPVTISTLEEFRLFQRHLNQSADGLAGISFRQEADITPGDYHFTYDETMDRYLIHRGDDRIGAIDRAGIVYQADGVTASSIKALGLTDLILQDWDDAKWFAGRYDGQGYYFRGFLLGVIDRQGSTYGGLFCDLGGGIISNVNVTDCCMHYCMSPLVNAMLSGTIENCHVSDIAGAADCSGGIAGLLWGGMIQNCTVERCGFRFRRGYQEGGTYGGLGGVVGVLEQNSGGIIRNCEVRDTVLHGEDFTQVGAGGIAGIVNTGRAGSILISGCSASVEIQGGRTAGGILGRIQKDGSGTVYVENCVCNGSMRDDADSSGSDAGGIVGRVGAAISSASVTDCISQMTIEKCSEKRRGTGTAGGIAGSMQGNCVIDGAVFAGQIQGKETAGSKGQTNCAGGIIGEMTAEGTVVNCVNFADICLGSSQENICGGLVGMISAGEDILVANSLTLGKMSGRICGGLVGMLDAGGAVYRIHNALSLGKLTGETVGNLAGEVLSGSFRCCYGREDMAQAFGSGSLETENCRQVSKEQLAGTEKLRPIFEDGDYSGFLTVREVLNAEADLTENRRSYHLWEDTQEGYPLPCGMKDSLPFVLRQLDGEWHPLPPAVGTPEPTGPTGQKTPEPTGQPGIGETPEPTGQPGIGETPEPTGQPGIGETPEPTGPETPAGSGMTSQPMQTDSGGVAATLSPEEGNPSGGNQKKLALVNGFRAKGNSNQSVILTWKKNIQATGYCIYRSRRKSSGYRVIRQCNSAKTMFKDRKCRPGQKYYYQIKAVYLQDGKYYQGQASRCMVKLAWLRSPSFRLSKGKNHYGEKYLQITMRKYDGKYVDVYLKKEKGHYRRVSMASHKIAVYRDKIRFTYQRSGVKYRCKIRTYKLVKGKKLYSAYSKAKKICL